MLGYPVTLRSVINSMLPPHYRRTRGGGVQNDAGTRVIKLGRARVIISSFSSQRLAARIAVRLSPWTFFLRQGSQGRGRPGSRLLGLYSQKKGSQGLLDFFLKSRAHISSLARGDLHAASLASTSPTRRKKVLNSAWQCVRSAAPIISRHCSRAIRGGSCHIESCGIPHRELWYADIPPHPPPHTHPHRHTNK
ncbi:hypothetical protein T492DRAFT_35218 [Pavlovales sp. CCMP2436]|nr:hypothetical protein T492DRAFT_35218 [Pavlovales sp. CCMP2436]